MPSPKKNESKQDYLKRCTAVLVGEGKKSDKAFVACNSTWQKSKDAELTELRHGFNLATPINLTHKTDAEGGAATGFLINAYTGKPVEMGWWGTFIFDVDGIEATNQMPVLREHLRDRIVGASSKFWKDKTNVFIQGKFSEATQDGLEVKALAEEGYPWQASVGIWPLEVEYLAEAGDSAKVNGMEVQGPIEIWRKSQIRETSFVSLGADDDTAGIGIHLSKACPVSVQVQYSSQITDGKEEIPMELKELLEMLIKAEPSNDDLATAFPEFMKFCTSQSEQGYIKLGREMGTDEEKTRIVEILKAEADPKVTLEAIEGGTPASDFYKLAYDHMRGVDAAKLKELAEKTPPPVVPVVPVEVKVPDGMGADVEVAKLASELAAKEGIPMDKATNKVLKADPELKEKYLAGFDS